MPEKNALTPDRIDWLDWLRVFALLAVVVQHTASQHWYDTDVNGAAWRCFNVFCSVTQWDVPVFVMISGALFLGREIPVRRICSKYVLRMAAAFCFWSAVYAAVGALGSGTSGLLTSLILGPYHLWFLFTITGLYLAFVLPTLEILVRDFGSEALIGRFGAAMMNVGQMRMYTVLGYGGYFVLGYWLSRTELSRRQRIAIYALGVLGALATIWLDLTVALRTQQPCDNYYGRFTLGVLLEAIAVFTLFRYAQLRPSAAVRRLSEWTFGAYLVHLLFVEHLEPLLGLSTLSFAPALSVPALSVLVAVLSYAVSAALHRVPFVKKYFV